ncbi:MAG: phosphatase [Parachlamydia sp.]|nr:MAG: phosphatase [Parachlamydia sp.]
MIDFRADMHCHSLCSDGTFSPEKLVELAHQIGLKGLSITDHDSIEAYPEAQITAERLGICLLSGVEFSTEHLGVSIHVLAYGFALQHPLIAQFCARHLARRIERNQEILALLRKHRMPIKEEELSAISTRGTVGRPHIALAMVKQGYVKTLREAFKKYLGEGKSCYAPGKAFSVEETLEVIHQAKGLAVIAHPHLIDNNRILRSLLGMPFDGIECYYGRFPLQIHERWLDIAHKKQWLISGGSDFHGEIKPDIALGCSWVNEELFDKFFQYFQQQTQNFVP